MPSVFGQVAQDVAENLYEIGRSAVKGTVKAVTDVAGESIEQITSAPASATTPVSEKPAMSNGVANQEMKKRAEMERFNEVRAELAQFVQRKQQLDQKIAEEKSLENQQIQQKEYVEKKKKESVISKFINMAQTGVEKGRMKE